MSFDLQEYSPEVRGFFGLPWTIELRRYDDGSYFAKVAELPGCMTEADSRTEVLNQLDDALAEWLTVAIEDGQTIPLPRSSDYSGKIFVRTSPNLHARVAEHAAALKVSMSQWIGEVLAREVASQSNNSEIALLRNEIAALRRVIHKDVRVEQPERHYPSNEVMWGFVKKYAFEGAARDEEPSNPPVEMDHWKERRRRQLTIHTGGQSMSEATYGV